MAQERFDLEKVHSSFLECLLDANDIQMDPYLQGYRELNK